MGGGWARSEALEFLAEKLVDGPVRLLTFGRAIRNGLARCAISALGITKNAFLGHP